MDDSLGDVETVLHKVVVSVFFVVPETIFDSNGFAETVFEADNVLDTVGVFDTIIEYVTDGVIIGVPVFLIEAVLVTDMVDVLLFDIERVFVAVADELLDNIGVLVTVFVGNLVKEYVGVTVIVLELPIDRVPLADAVPVLDDVVVDVDVADIRVDIVERVVIVIEDDIEDVLEIADEREIVLLNDEVRVDLREWVSVGLALGVFELDTLAVCVFEIYGEPVVL